MIAIDTSSFIAYLSGARGEDVEVVDTSLEHGQAVLPPAVLTELLSDPELKIEVKQLFVQLPQVQVLDGYWERVGLLRALLISKGRKARLADSLIAQSCLDHDLPLITRDRDFRFFAQLAGLKLL